MKPDREHLVASPHAPTFENTLAELLDDFHKKVALARTVHLLSRQMNELAGTDVAGEDTGMAEMLDRNIKLLSEVAELAGQPRKLPH